MPGHETLVRDSATPTDSLKNKRKLLKSRLDFKVSADLMAHKRSHLKNLYKELERWKRSDAPDLIIIYYHGIPYIVNIKSTWWKNDKGNEWFDVRMKVAWNQKLNNLGQLPVIVLMKTWPMEDICQTAASELSYVQMRSW